MRKKAFITVFVMVFSLTASFSQTSKNTTKAEQIWMGYFNQTRFSNHWGIWADVHLRTKDQFVEELSQAIGRLGLTYYINDVTKVTSGYAFVNHFPADNHNDVSQPEHRMWQQLQWHTKYKKIRTMQWVRLEERWRHKIKDYETLAEGYNYNWRIRYNFFLQAPLSKKGFAPHTFSFVTNNEIMINFGKQIVYNIFDQNRFFIGIAYQTNAHDNLQFGYMNVFQQLAAGNQYKSINTCRFFYFHNLDLRKKKP